MEVPGENDVFRTISAIDMTFKSLEEGKNVIFKSKT
ncbi:hypothetical protein CW304_00220 [Bacillus sp. UFRGS-B20]|nr:hypothetical protein CW304_00220 [Bacillus sp. UFRGS-B20]